MAIQAKMEEAAFYESLGSFWGSKGVVLAEILPFTQSKAPVINLYMLDRIVRKLGGSKSCTESDLWETVVECVVDSRLLPNPEYADELVPMIRSLYVKVLLPYAKSNYVEVCTRYNCGVDDIQCRV
mmetsp:Transcript_36752/g.59383  ORF Transcript_36752/g.59383 Transcript_36752/m.59383 type:complete len:126 (+) Transcript_36752:155-532(+)